MRFARAAAVIVLLVAAAPVAAQNGSERLHVAVRRVHISAGFSGEEVFIYGRVPAGSERVVSIIESPATATVRLMEKGRVGPFWLGVHQYAVHDVPKLYLVSLSCPEGNVLHPCPESDSLAVVNS
ncbi:MAG: TIGR02186 family protein, partial [Acidobacteria bacterium]|nr:TIGR02186 family protein [Acidobacteriota bacterium]